MDVEAAYRDERGEGAAATLGKFTNDLSESTSISLDSSFASQKSPVIVPPRKIFLPVSVRAATLTHPIPNLI